MVLLIPDEFTVFIAMAHVSLKCANCQANGLKKLSLLFLQGTAARSSFTIGFYRGLRGNFVANTFGTRQSLLAQRAAPPRKKSLLIFGAMWFVACSVVALVALAVLSNSDQSQALTVSAVLWCAAFAGGLIWRSKGIDTYNKRVWPKAYATWERSYLCMQCGRINVI